MASTLAMTLAGAISLPVIALPPEKELPAGSGLAEALWVITRNPDLDTSALEPILDFDRKVVSQRVFAHGQVFEVPPRDPASGIGMAVVVYRDDGKTITSTRFELEQDPRDCSPVVDFGRGHGLMPRPIHPVSTPDGRLTGVTYGGYLGGVRVFASSHHRNLDCIGSLHVIVRPPVDRASKQP